MTVKKLSSFSIAAFVEKYTSPIALLVVSPLDVIVALAKSTCVSNRVAVLVETVNFVMVCVNPCENQMVIVNVKLLGGKKHTCYFTQNEKINVSDCWSVLESIEYLDSSEQRKCRLVNWSQFHCWVSAEESVRNCRLVRRFPEIHASSLVGRQRLL